MSDPRFIVTVFTGIVIPTGHGYGDGHTATSYYVQGTLYNYNVVRTYENIGKRWHSMRAVLKRQAERECARLNEWWEYERKRG